MNFAQKQVIGGFAAVIGIFLAILGIVFWTPGAWIGAALFLGGVGLMAYNMYTMFSGKAVVKGMDDMMDMAEQLSKELEKRMDRGEVRVSNRSFPPGIRRSGGRRNGMFDLDED